MQSRPFSANAPGLLFAGAILTSMFVLWFFAIPILDTSNIAAHVSHGVTLYLHVLSGLFVIVAGGCALYIGWTKKAFRRHKWFGYCYLGLGSMMSLSALMLSFSAPHEPRSLYVATGTLSVVWLAVAALALRAGWNRQFQTHRDWMIRSYLLTWTFVGCRIATSINMFPALGTEGVTAAIWVNWVVPFVICEISLQWSAASKKTVPPL